MLVWECGKKQELVAYDLGVWRHAPLGKLGALSY